jgi:hypothetical protein
MIGKSKAWALALLGAALLLGGVAGAAVDRVLVGGSAEAATSRRGSDRDRRSSYLDHLSAELQLTEDQRSQVQVIVEQHREQVSALWREMRPRFEELKGQVHAEIRELLTEEQRTAYEALLDKEARRRHGRKGRR